MWLSNIMFYTVFRKALCFSSLMIDLPRLPFKQTPTLHWTSAHLFIAERGSAVVCLRRELFSVVKSTVGFGRDVCGAMSAVL